MKHSEIENGFQKTIDQYYSQLKYMKDGYRDMSELWFIGGILQAALHILPTDMYYGLKQYIYDKHGYDPGGVASGQINITEWEGMKNETM